jgi:hypothetical protein
VRFAVDMLATVVPSSGGGYGLTLSAQAFVLPFLAVRIGGGFRLGAPIPETGATFESTTYFAAVGAAAYALRPTRSRPFGAWIRLDFLEEYQILSRTTPDGNSQRWSSWPPAPALDGVADVSFLFLDDVEVVAGGGVEVALLPEQIWRTGLPPEPLPVVRGVGEAGIRVRF